MLRIVKQLFFGLLLGFFLLVAFVFGYFYFNQDKIVQLLIDEVNRNINTQVDVENVTMSFWERFPQISIKFEHVTLYNSELFGKETDQNLLETDFVYFDLDLKTLISSKPQIRRIAIGPGNLNLMVDKQKRANFDIVKGSGSGETQLEIGNIEVEQLKVNYIDYSNIDKYAFDILNADISANFGLASKKFDLNLTIKNPTFIPDQYNYFDDYGFAGEVILSDDSEINWLGIANFNNLEVENKGSFQYKTESLVVEVSGFSVGQKIVSSILKKVKLPVKAEQLELTVDQLRLSFSPNSFLLNSDYSVSGDIGINEKFGPININNTGSVSIENEKLRIRADQFNAQFENSTLKFAGNYQFPSHKVVGDLSFHIELSDFEESIRQYKIEDPHGILDGSFQIIPARDKERGLIGFKKGEVGLTNVSFNLTDNHLVIQDVQSLMYLSEDEILVEELKGIVNKNDVEYSGSMKGLVAYLFSDGTLNVSGDVFSNEFYLSDFLYASPESQTGTIQLGEKLNLMLNVIVKDIRNNNFKGENLSLDLEKKGQNVDIKNFDIQTSDGHLRGKGVFVEQNNGEWYTTLSANFQQIDIRSFFAEMNEFGQSYIVSDNIKGQLNADVNVDFVFTPDFRVKTKSIYLDANVVVNSGELVDFKTLEELSDFVSLDELKDIKFETLKNRISIHDNKIVIPKMQIRSSAIDIGLMGEHGFNNIIDYQISVGLSDVLFGKLPRRFRKESKRRKNKKLTLFVDITGNINDPKISVSKISRERVINVEQKSQKKKKFEVEFDDL